MCFIADETCTVWNEKTISKAKKEHKCSACNEPILSGEAYVYQFGVFDGESFSNKLCFRCCYDSVRVVCHELDSGCDWSEAWPFVDVLVGYLRNGSEDGDEYILDGEDNEIDRHTGLPWKPMGQTPKDKIPAEFSLAEWPRGPIERIRGNTKPTAHPEKYAAP